MPVADNLANILRCTDMDSDLRSCAIDVIGHHIEAVLSKFRYHHLEIDNIFIFKDNSAVVIYAGRESMDVISSLEETPGLVKFIVENLKAGKITGVKPHV